MGFVLITVFLLKMTTKCSKLNFIIGKTITFAAKSQENAKSPTSEHNKSQPPDDDDALQEQYLVEYAKELSLVETHGSNQQYQLHEGWP